MAFGKPNFAKYVPGNPRKWVADKVAKLRERKANEATMLKPIALAGASKGFSGRSQLCNSFARTQVLQHRASPAGGPLKLDNLEDTNSEEDNEDEGEGDDDSEGTSSSRSATSRSQRQQYQHHHYQHKRALLDEGQWKPCHMCSRHFLRRDSKFADFCSLDCKSAAYLGVGGAYEY